MSNQGRFGKYGEFKRFSRMRDSNKAKVFSYFKQPLKHISKHGYVRRTADRILKAGSY